MSCASAGELVLRCHIAQLAEEAAQAAPELAAPELWTWLAHQLGRQDATFGALDLRAPPQAWDQAGNVHVTDEPLGPDQAVDHQPGWHLRMQHCLARARRVRVSAWQIPGLLRTPGYDKALACMDPHPEELAAPSTQAGEREATVLLQDTALYRPVGYRGLYVEQLRYVHDLAAGGASVEVRILTLPIPACGTDVYELDLPCGQRLYLEAVSGGVHYATGPAGARYHRLLDQVQAAALSRADSLEHITAALSETQRSAPPP